MKIGVLMERMGQYGFEKSMGCQTFFMPLGDGHEHWTSHVGTGQLFRTASPFQSLDWSAKLDCLRGLLFFHIANPVIN